MHARAITRAALGVGMAILLAMGPGLASAAPNDTPQTAVVFSGTVSGDIEAVPPLLGSGKYAFLRFQYPGDNSVVTIDVDITPGDPGAAANAGFRVYGPTNGQLYAQSGQTGKHPSHEAQFSSTEAGTYLVEIYNANVVPIHYEATAIGLPPQAAVVPAPAAAPGASAPASAAPTPTAAPVVVGQNTSAERAAWYTAPVNARLSGSQAGSFHYYRFNYAGDGSTVTVDLDVSPSDTQTTQTAGFVIYGPTAGREYTRGGYQGKSPTHSTTLITTEPGTYLVQVFNYGPAPIQYQMNIAGLPAPAAAALTQAAPAPAASAAPAGASTAPVTTAPPIPVSGPITVGLNTAPDRAADLTEPVSAVLLGGQVAVSHYYRFSYPGDGSSYRLDLDVSPSDAATGQATGFVVYGPTAGREYARAAYRGGSPTHSGALVSNEPGTYVVQVFNNSPSAVAYRLALTPRG